MQDFLKQIIREAGYLAKGYYLEGVTHTFKSSPTDLITIADQETSNFLIEKIKEKYPDHGIISEEEDDEINSGAEYTWVIDPIDGTRNFANKIGVWCVMVGITKNGKPYMGAVYDAMNDELFFAEVGCGAYLNDEKIKVSEHSEVENSFLMFSGGMVNDTVYSTGERNYNNYLKFYNNLMGNTGHWVHNYGTMLACCHVAVGRMDAFILNTGLYHDYLAPYVIATEAGAVWTDSKGEPWVRGKRDVVVANSKLHEKLLELFK